MTKLPEEIEKLRDDLARVCMKSYYASDAKGVVLMDPVFSGYCSGFDAGYLEGTKREARLREALEQMHNVVVGKNHEPHISLTSNPLQNGCYVYTEWALKDIKDKALAETSEK